MISSFYENLQRIAPAERIALGCIAAFASLAFLAPHAAMLAGLVLVGVTFARPRAAFRDMLRDPVLLLFVILSIYVLTRAGFAASEFPSLREDHWEQAVRAGIPVLLLPVAWWLRGDLRRVFAVLIVALGAFCIDMLIELDWERLPVVLTTVARDGINGTYLATALYTGTGILGLIAFGPRLWRATSTRSNGQRALALGGWVLAMGILLIAQYITLTRSMIASLVVLAPLLIILLWWPHRRGGSRQSTWLLVGLAVLVLGGFGVITKTPLKDRMTGAVDAFAQAAQGDLSEVEKSSAGIRLHMWHFGAELISERPVFGWGPGTRAVRYLAEQRDRPMFLTHGDLHNEWVQMVFWFGFTGLVLYGALLLLLFRAGIRSYRAGAMPRDMFLFLATSMVLLAGWTVINSRLLDLDFQYYLILMLGTMYTFHLKVVGRQPPDPPPTPAP